MIEIRCHTRQDLLDILKLHESPYALLHGSLSYKITIYRDEQWVAVGGHSKKATTMLSYDATNGWVIR